MKKSSVWSLVAFLSILALSLLVFFMRGHFPLVGKELPDQITMIGGKDGKYCKVGADKTLTCQSDTEAHVDVQEIEPGYLAILDPSRKYFCSDEADKKRIICNRSSIGAWEKFRYARSADKTTMTLRGGHRNKLCSDEGTRVVCSRDKEGPWEKFGVDFAGASNSSGSDEDTAAEEGDQESEQAEGAEQPSFWDLLTEFFASWFK